MAFLRYTVQRMLLLVSVLGLAWLAGLRGLLLVLVGVFGSGLLSLFLLWRSRDAASASLSARLTAINRRIDERSAAEDAWQEQVRKQQQPPARPPEGGPAARDWRP